MISISGVAGAIFGYHLFLKGKLNIFNDLSEKSLKLFSLAKTKNLLTN